MNAECPFCTSPEVHKRCIARNEYVAVFPTNIPIVPLHILIAPLRHASTLAELSSKERDALFDMAQRMATVLKKKFGARGFNFAWNEGTAGGQSVSHLHLHLVPRKTGDNGITEYEPRKFLYRPGSREKTPENELQVVADSIRCALEE